MLFGRLNDSFENITKVYKSFIQDKGYEIMKEQINKLNVVQEKEKDLNNVYSLLSQSFKSLLI